MQTRWRACLPNGGGSLRVRNAGAWLDGTSSTEYTQMPKVPSEVWSTRRDGLYECEADALQDHKDRRGDVTQRITQAHRADL